jgi:hypothetical protein
VVGPLHPIQITGHVASGVDVRVGLSQRSGFFVWHSMFPTRMGHTYFRLHVRHSLCPSHLLRRRQHTETPAHPATTTTYELPGDGASERD